MVEGTPQNQDYVVLARKYRSRTFAELIGQEALVRTLSNAIAAQRIHHAYVLTGIRGVGKTSTARLLAMALNCENGPAVTWSEDDPQVQAIRAGTHVDVLEFDAASNRGAEDVADLLSGVNYAPVMGRTKVYIIDEVHMLSTHAFNALLKTLEEPPPRVKFIFATTEVQKIPVTVLSRCQRFDLKRIPSAVLQAHFAAILKKEQIPAEPEAVALVARAADGSVRDGLSLLDQAIALSQASGDGGANVRAALVQDMLGLADRVKVYELLEALLSGEPVQALAVLDDLYAGGQDALLVVQGLLDTLHLVTRIKIVKGLRDSAQLSELERTRGVALADRLGTPNLSRAYQMLAQAAQEVKQAERPYEALAMAAVRVGYLAPLPGLDQLMAQAAPVLQQATAQPAAASAGAMAVHGPMFSAPVPPPAVVAQAVKAVNASVAGAKEMGPAPWEDAPVAKPFAQIAQAMDAPPAVVPGPPQPVVQDAGSTGSWKDIVKLVQTARPALAAALGQQVRCLKVVQAGEPDGPALVIAVEKGLHGPAELTAQLKEALKAATEQVWQVKVDANASAAEGIATLREVAVAEDTQRREAAVNDPVVKQVLHLFPGAVVEQVTVADA